MGKININKDHKATMFSALGAFILSMLIGLISGNPATVVFVRAVVSALLFSAVVFGALYLLRRYIPEFEEDLEKKAAVDETDLGNKVNYKSPDREATEEKTDGETGAEGVGVLSSDHAAAPFEGGGESPLGGDSEPLSPTTAFSEMTASSEGDTGIPMDELQPFVETPRTSSLNGLEDITLGGAEENGNGVVEDLPSLDKLYEEHEQVSVPDIGTSGVGSKGKSKAVGDYIEVGNARIPFEPEVLAKAVKKVMKEDE